MKILAIGNSFSDDTLEYVYSIAASAKIKDLVLGNLYIGGCSLETHAENAHKDLAAYAFRTNDSGVWNTQPDYRLKDALSKEKWDYISMQQASHFSGRPEMYEPYLSELIAYVKELAPQAKLIWNMTWAYQSDFSGEGFVPYDRNQKSMYERILNAVKTQVLPHSEITKLVPCGTAVQNARTSFIGDTLTRDGFHLSFGFGRYVVGLTFAKAVLGVSLKEVRFVPEGVTEREREIAVEAAENACQEPFAVTQSKK